MEKLNLKECYDVIIIGSGISGLTSAALLGKSGLSVCVLEKDTQPGGYLAGYEKKNFRFETAIHWLNQCNPGGFVRQMFDFIGADSPKVMTLNNIRRIHGLDYNYLLTSNPDELMLELIKKFPHEEKGILRFFGTTKRMAKYLNNFNAIFLSPETMTLTERIRHVFKLLHFSLPYLRFIRFYGEKGTTKGLNKFFKDKGIHEIFNTEMDMISCLIPIAWAYHKDYQIPPQGGSRTFAEWLVHVIKFYKGDILYNANVKKILLDGKTARGVEFEHRKQNHQVKAKYVVAACDVGTLYEKMLPPSASSPKFRKNLQKALLYDSALTVNIALDCPAENLGVGEELILLSKDYADRDLNRNKDPETCKITMISSSVRDKSLVPEKYGMLSIYMPAHFNDHDFWKTTSNGSPEREYIRGDEYKKQKDDIAQKLIDRVVEKLIPNLREHILFYDVATPITHWRYTGNRNGSIMGAKPGYANIKAGVAHYKTPVSGLLLSGHWADIGGGVPIAIKAALNTSLLILRIENMEAFQLLGDYINGTKTLKEIEKATCFVPYDNSWKQSDTPAKKYEKQIANQGIIIE